MSLKIEGEIGLQSARQYLDHHPPDTTTQPVLGGHPSQEQEFGPRNGGELAPITDKNIFLDAGVNCLKSLDFPRRKLPRKPDFARWPGIGYPEISGGIGNGDEEINSDEKGGLFMLMVKKASALFKGKPEQKAFVDLEPLWEQSPDLAKQQLWQEYKEAKPYIDDEGITLEVEIVEAVWLVNKYQKICELYGEEHELVLEVKNEAIRKLNILEWKTDKYIKQKG